MNHVFSHSRKCFNVLHTKSKSFLLAGEEQEGPESHGPHRVRRAISAPRNWRTMLVNRESLMVGIRDTHAVSSQIRGDVQSRSFA